MTRWTCGPDTMLHLGKRTAVPYGGSAKPSKKGAYDRDSASSTGFLDRMIAAAVNYIALHPCLPRVMTAVVPSERSCEAAPLNYLAWTTSTMDSCLKDDNLPFLIHHIRHLESLMPVRV